MARSRPVRRELLGRLREGWPREVWSLGLAAVLTVPVALPLLAAVPALEPFEEEPRRQILLLGTFHFSDAGLDSYRPEHEVDIFSERRQAELAEVLDRLAAFRPTKIAVEVMPARQPRLDEQYRAYLQGEYELSSHEIDQIAYRLARRLGHERVWAVDAERRFYEPWVDPDEYAARHGQVEVLEDPWPERYEALYRYEDRLKMTQTLREALLYRNRPEVVRRNAGRYLVGGFKAGVGDEYPGVDSRTAWYNRNLRIFANLQRITEREDERILLVIGAGHLGILRHAVEVSPEYRLVEVEEYLGDPEPRASAPGSGRRGKTDDTHSLFTEANSSRDALELIRCARESAAAVGESVWPGWSEAPFSVLLVSGDAEYLVCPSAAMPVEGFAEIPDAGGFACPVLKREARFDEGLLATFPALGPEPTIVVGTPEATGKAAGRWLVTLLHEHFHQLQYSRPWYYQKTAELGLSRGDETGMWMLNYPFPYEDPEVGKRFASLSKALGEALEARETAEFAPALRRVKSAWRALADRLEADDDSYLQFQLWQEGVARYVELRAAEVLAAEGPGCLEGVTPSMADVAGEIRKEITDSLGNPVLAEEKRVAFYAVGAAIALLLDETSPGWQVDYFRRPFTVEHFLREEAPAVSDIDPPVEPEAALRELGHLLETERLMKRHARPVGKGDAPPAGRR